MTFYSGLQSTALNLLTKFGQTVTFSYETAGTYDPETGGTTGAVTNTQDVKGVTVPFNLSEIDGTLIEQGDLTLITSESFEPKTGYSVDIGGTTYQVKNVEPVSPAGIDVIYKSQVRK